jgi:type I restriction enzyme S subunit
MTMAADKQDKVLNVPTLRFPEYSDKWLECELQDIADLSKGAGISKDQLSETGESCILYGELYTKYKSEVISNVVSKTNIESTNLVRSKANDVIIPSSGETAIDISTARCVPYDNILLGGDLNIIRLKDQDGRFFSYQLNGVRKLDIAQIAQGVSVVHLYGESLKRLKVRYPSKSEQEKISSLLSVLDERIETQNRIIEDLKQLRSALIENMYSHMPTKCKVGDAIMQVSMRNRDNTYCTVLSVNNRRKFIEQSEQFEDRIVASDDTSNYKVVKRNDFAYNPARINVGSIARLTTFEDGIVSPMYICFQAKQQILPEYLEYFFYTRYFHNEMLKRLEGSVRMCLSWDSLCNIPLTIPNIEQQRVVSRRISILTDKIIIEEKYKEYLMIQKHYLLKAMFI